MSWIDQVDPKQLSQVDREVLAEMLNHNHYVPFKTGKGDPGDSCECGEDAAVCPDLDLKLRLVPE